MIDRFVDGLGLGHSTLVAISTLLLFHIVLVHPCLFLGRHLRFLDSWSCHLRANHTLMLVDIGLIALGRGTWDWALFVLSCSGLSRILMHDLIKSLLIKVTTALVLRTLINGLWSSLWSCGMCYHKRLLIARPRRLHLLLASLWLLLLR